MEQYLRRGRVGAVMDDVGLHFVLLLVGIGWFVWLWGVGMAAVLAGVALGLLMQTALRQYRKRTVRKREMALRRRLGGEMLLEEMLLAPEKQAHFQAALLLGMKYPLTMERVTADGMLCVSRGETLLAACAALPAGEEVAVTTLLSIARAAKKWNADRCVVCVTGRIGNRASAWAEASLTRMTLIGREVLLDLAGQACPATDEQLVALGKRRRRGVPQGSRLRGVLRRDKAKRYLLYGTGLTLMYLVTGLWYYPIPGLICLMLAVLSLIRPKPPEML